ncbi:MAG: alanine--tRNA ligase [Candidatus Saccharibacteria bacterium]
MNAQQIRNEYLKFFASRKHAVIKRANLVPLNDPTTLFTGSGMQPLLPYLLGQTHPDGVRLTNSQTCFRAQDVDEVGDNRHTTFFEMLGNWSLGDYFKEQQIRWFFEFLTDVVGLDPNNIYVSAFIGDQANGIPRDDETAQIWQKVFADAGITAEIAEIGSQEDGDRRGIKPGERIFFYDDAQNWWSRGGGIDSTPIGDPCGPDSEVFYDFGEQNHDASYGHAHPASDSGRFLEIGNQVFMQYRRLEDGSFEPLAKQNVDFGGGLERIAAAAINSPDVFKISTIWPIIEKIQELSNKKYDFTPGDLGYDEMPECWLDAIKSKRVIADHLRAATFLAVDGVRPSNKEQGYVMRRLLRRAIRFALELGIEQNFLAEIVPVIADIFNDDYPEVAANRDEVIAVLVKEEKVFRQTLNKGLREFSKFAVNGLTGAELFMLHDTFGFPVELSVEEATKQGIELSENWRAEFDAKMAEQRERSQTAAKGTFKGGLEGDSDIHKKYHTTAHLMSQALRMVLGDSVSQCGANINEERIRFDFKYPEKVADDKLRQIEDIVNEQIGKDLAVTFAEYPLEEARAMGAVGEFSDKYGDKVRVYKIADSDGKAFSLEICGGPHITHTGELAEGGERFKIIKEESSSAGVRRIKAVLA